MHPALRHYYYYSSSSDPSQTLADAFNARVVADSGTYESDSCLVDQISTLRTMGFWDDATFVLTPNGYKLNKLYAVVPTDASGDLTFTRPSPKRRVNSSAATEVLASGMPSIDYTGGGCPAILFEKPTTNLFTFEDDLSNGAWTKSAASVTANNTTDPLGGSTADRILETTANAGHYFLRALAKAASSLQYAATIYVKANGRSWFRLDAFNGANGVGRYFDVTNGALGTPVTYGAGFTLDSSRIDAIANGWYRVEMIFTTTTATSVSLQYQIATADGTASYAGDITKGLYFWRVRLEQASVASTSVNDLITAKSAQALIGQTEGTLFFKGSVTADGVDKILGVCNNTADHRAIILLNASNKAQGVITAGGVTQMNITAPTAFVTGQEVKIALVYKGDYAALFVDGVKIEEDVSVTVPTLTHICFDNGAGSFPFIGRLKQYSLLDRALTFSEAVERTLLDGEVANSQVLVDGSSHCWFARDKAVYHAGSNKTFFSQVHHNEDGIYSQYIFQLDHATNEVTKFRLGTVEQFDDHNEASIIIRASDSKLFVAYTEHSASVIRYRTSTNALDISAWGAEQTVDPNATSSFTYPSCFEDASGDIFIFFRDALGGTVSTWSYIKSTDGGSTFGSYTNYSTFTYSNAAQDPNNKDLIHFVVSKHPGDSDDPNWICSFYFNAGTGTFHKTDGTNVTASIPLDASEIDIIQQNSLPTQCWIEDITVDSTGKPRVLFFIIPDWTDVTTALNKDEYYSEWTGSSWTTPHLLHRASSTHHMETDSGSIQERWYGALGAFDRANPDRIFSSKEVSGVCEIHKLTRVSASNFTTEQMTSGNTFDQWRPFTTAAPTKNVFWLNKVRYNYWLDDYYQQLMCDTF